MIEFENILDNMHENTHTIHAIVSPLASNDMANVPVSYTHLRAPRDS